MALLPRTPWPWRLEELQQQQGDPPPFDSFTCNFIRVVVVWPVHEKFQRFQHLANSQRPGSNKLL